MLDIFQRQSIYQHKNSWMTFLGDKLFKVYSVDAVQRNQGHIKVIAKKYALYSRLLAIT